MDIIGKILSGLWDLFISLLVGLFDAFKPLFIVAIIVIVIIAAVYLGKALYYSNKEERDEKKYIKALKDKYARYSRNERKEIYDDFVNLRNCMIKSVNAEKKEKYATSDEEKMSLLVTQMAATIVLEELSSKYAFSFESKYIHHDIAYLEKTI